MFLRLPIHHDLPMKKTQKKTQQLTRIQPRLDGGAVGTQRCQALQSQCLDMGISRVPLHDVEKYRDDAGLHQGILAAIVLRQFIDHTWDHLTISPNGFFLGIENQNIGFVRKRGDSHVYSKIAILGYTIFGQTHFKT